MIYIYNDYGGTHTTALAASYHLNKLDRNREPSKEEILSAHNFNELTYKDRGKLFFFGNDEDGNKVFTVGRGTCNILIPGLYNLTDMLQKEGVLEEKIIFSCTSPTVPAAMTFGGFLSRWAKIDFIGVPLLVRGAKQTWRNIVDLVDFTKKMGKMDERHLILLDNKQFMSPKKLIKS